MRYVVVGSKPWLRRIFDESLAVLPGEWVYVGNDLTLDMLREIEPRFVFFLHWSERVPAEVHESFECVNFHMTEVPYGRGGSPLQNLIARGHQTTVVSAIGMVDELDAGPVYAKRPMTLDGTAEEVYVRAARLSADMIVDIIARQPAPTEQTGEVVPFRRRTPADSEIRLPASLVDVYDAVRMLDADGYPHAFLRVGGLRLEFTRANRYADSVRAEVRITEVKP
jgi:methionyl-tRNA formyltransferase